MRRRRVYRGPDQHRHDVRQGRGHRQGTNGALPIELDRLAHLDRRSRRVSHRQRVQDIDHPAHIQRLAQPARHRCPRVEVESLRVVVRSQRIDGVARHLVRRRGLGQDPPVRTAKLKLAIRLSSWTARWCRRQSRARFESVVEPPCAQCRRWCPWPKGRPQPGNRQPRSRCRSARRNAGGIVRVRAPISSSRPSASCSITTRLASHARRRDVSAETRMPSSSTDWPGCSGSASTGASTCTTTW